MTVADLPNPPAPDLVGPADTPDALARQARGQGDQGAPQADASYGAANKAASGRYLDRAAHRAYLTGRRQLVEGIDYGPAAPVVERVQRERDELRRAVVDFERARQGVETADRADVAETIAATEKGRDVRPRHGTEARAQLDAADLAAAVALRRAVEGEHALGEALSRHALAIREARQRVIDDDRRQLVEDVDRVRQRIARIEANESTLGQFEREAVAVTVSPTAVVNLRPADAPPGWAAPIGSPHGVVVRDVLATGRTLPRAPRHALDAVKAWAAEVPWATAWRVDGSAVTMRDITADAPAGADSPRGQRKRAKSTTGATATG